MPKLAVAVASACHLILSAVPRMGHGSDAPDFDSLLFNAWRRVSGVKLRVDGRPTSKPPTGRWRRHMAKRFKRKADQKTYAERSQSETVHSMIKRNQSSALRSRTPARQKKEMMMRVLTHNIMLLAKLHESES